MIATYAYANCILVMFPIQHNCCTYRRIVIMTANAPDCFGYGTWIDLLCWQVFTWEHIAAEGVQK